MRILSSKYVVVFVCLLLVGCSSGGVFEKPNSTGKSGELSIVVDGRLRSGEAVRFLRDALSRPVEGLPQVEPLFDVTTIPSDIFSAMFRMMRNLVVISINPELLNDTIIYNSDFWAKNQAMVRIDVRSDSLLLPFLISNETNISMFFVNEERSRFSDYYRNNCSLSLLDSLKRKFEIAISIPIGYSIYKEAPSFYWLEQEIGVVQQAIMVYSFDLNKLARLSLETLLMKRDSVLKVNMPGKRDGSYMVTEYECMPISKIIEVNNKKVMSVSGLWRVEGDLMGGPFILTAFVDVKRNRIVVLDGFVYSPEKPNKRNYIRQLEAVMQTFLLTNILDGGSNIK